MARVVSIFLPDLPTDRIRRDDPAIPDDQPIAVIAKSGAKRWVASADAAARQIGVRVGMPAAKAQAIFQGLMLVDADPMADARARVRIGKRHGDVGLIDHAVTLFRFCRSGTPVDRT